MGDRAWSPQQEEIFSWFGAGRGVGNLVVRARAGAGKTSTILEGIGRSPERNILLCAFNKRIQEELQGRLSNPRAEARTLHALGFAAVKEEWEGARVAKNPTIDRAYALTDAIVGPNATKAVRRLVTKLHTLARETLPHATSPEELDDLAVAFDCEPEERSGTSTTEVCQYAVDAMELAASAPPPAGIDFADMIFLPVRNGWMHAQYDLVCVDECVPGWTPVMLADGSSSTIKEIVESEEPVEVRSYNVVTGREMNCRVTGRHKILNRKPLVKISTKYQEPYTRGRNFVVCTVDHKVWTGRGWIPAGELVIGDTVLVETAAEKSERGKITAKGKQELARLRKGNTYGVGNKGGTISVRGGNGHGPTLAEQCLLDALGPGWESSYVIPTKAGRAVGGLPTHYKIDIANPQAMVAVEVDGSTHQGARREHDRRKDQFLEERGWRVIRVNNRDAIQNPSIQVERILAFDCPRYATVAAIEPTTIRDSYVYDIDVEECHAFYANGVLVHNCQDMTVAQLELALGATTTKGRVVVVGDDRQAIYGFRGVDSGALDRLKRELCAQELGLTTTYRCSQSVVKEAQRLVPDIEAAASNPEGLVLHLEDDRLHSRLIENASDRREDFVLSRTNAPLARVALALLRKGTRARIAGKDIGAGLRAIVEKLSPRPDAPIETFLSRLDDWERSEVDRAVRLHRSEGQIGVIYDKADTLRALADTDDVDRVGLLLQRIDSLFADEGARQVVCSTVHKAKGLEAERVFVLDDTLYRFGAALEEQNIEYVAVTRAIDTLVRVGGGEKV